MRRKRRNDGIRPGSTLYDVESKCAFHESERRYRALVENFPNGVVELFDEELRYTAVSGELVSEIGVR